MHLVAEGDVSEIAAIDSQGVEPDRREPAVHSSHLRPSLPESSKEILPSRSRTDRIAATQTGQGMGVASSHQGLSRQAAHHHRSEQVLPMSLGAIDSLEQIERRGHLVHEAFRLAEAGETMKKMVQNIGQPASPEIGNEIIEITLDRMDLPVLCLVQLKDADVDGVTELGKPDRDLFPGDEVGRVRMGIQEGQASVQ